MKNELKMPAHCAVVSEDEMTYVEGGSYLDALSTAATVVGAVVLGASYVWGIGTARSWLNQKENRKGNVFTVIGRALDDIGEDMSLPAGCGLYRCGGGSGPGQRGADAHLSRLSRMPLGTP